VVQFGDVRFAIDLPFFWLLRRTGIPMADVCHNVRPFRRSGALTAGSTLNGRLYRSLYRLFDRVFVHFEANRRTFQEDFDLPREKVSTILHGNQDVFRELGRRGRPVGALRAELGLSPDDRVILFFGTLSRYKGTDLLLEAFPGILAAEPRAALVLAGFPQPGFDLEAHREEARRLGLEERVRFHARYLPSEDVPAWMALADVVAYPYRTVFQSGAIHLAQTFGRPLVATKVGAFPEVVAHGTTGLLIPPDDAAALRDAVSLILARPDMAHFLGRRAALDASVRFDWMRPAGIVVGEYGRMLGRAAMNGMPGDDEG
jgi:glycosyltransferase involved in cell wall biosynthesis